MASFRRVTCGGGRRVVVLVVQWQVVDADLAEGEIRGPELRDGASELLVVRLLAQATDDDGDAIFAHGTCLLMTTIVREV